MCLYYNYNKVIRPRGDLLKDKQVHFELHEAFQMTDKQFCRRWNINIDELRKYQKLREREHEVEIDHTWAYIKQF